MRERWLNEEWQKYSSRKTHNCHWEKNNTAKDLMVWNTNNMQQHTTCVNIVNAVIYLIFWIIESLSLSPYLSSCVKCALSHSDRQIFSQWDLWTFSFDNDTKMIRIPDNHVLYNPPFCPILLHPMSLWWDTLQLAHATCFKYAHLSQR